MSMDFGSDISKTPVGVIICFAKNAFVKELKEL